MLAPGRLQRGARTGASRTGTPTGVLSRDPVTAQLGRSRANTRCPARRELRRSTNLPLTKTLAWRADDVDRARIRQLGTTPSECDAPKGEGATWAVLNSVHRSQPSRWAHVGTEAPDCSNPTYGTACAGGQLLNGPSSLSCSGRWSVRLGPPRRGQERVPRYGLPSTRHPGGVHRSPCLDFGWRQPCQPRMSDSWLPWCGARDTRARSNRRRRPRHANEETKCQRYDVGFEQVFG